MNKIIDLHIHSNFSEDADLSVAEIFDLAHESSVSAISITDHDSVHSIDKANLITKDYPFEYVPGVEITTVFPVDNSQQHILGYFVNNKNTGLIDCLKRIADFRIEIAKKRIEALKKLNFFLNEDKIQKMTEGRPPTAVSIIIELLGNINNLHDERLQIYLKGEKKDNKIANFYNDYFTEKGAAYVPFQSISSQEGIDIIKQAGGIPIIAHPVFLKKKEWLNIFKEMGIQGIEAISSYHKQEDIEFYIGYANKNNILITAGSDYHGPRSKPKIKIAHHRTAMNYSYFEKLKEFHREN